MEERIRGSWWLAPPGNWRRFQITMAGLVVLGLFGLAAGIAAAAFGQPPGNVLLIGVGTPLVAEFVLFGIPVRVAGEARFTLPATPERLFTIASDPQMMVRLSPAGLRLIQSSGEAGHVGSRFVMTASGLRMAIRVVRSDPPREIVRRTFKPGVFTESRWRGSDYAGGFQDLSTVLGAVAPTRH